MRKPEQGNVDVADFPEKSRDIDSRWIRASRSAIWERNRCWIGKRQGIRDALLIESSAVVDIIRLVRLGDVRIRVDIHTQKVLVVRRKGIVERHRQADGRRLGASGR